MNSFICSLFVSVSLLGAGDQRYHGKLVLVAGGGAGADGTPAKTAELTSPFGIAFDAHKTLYFVEMTGHRVRKIGSDGLVRTVAGTGKVGNDGDGGPAASGEFNSMHSLAAASNGDLYIADTWNNRVRKIDAQTGKISAFAGTGKKGFSGDGGPALDAEFGGVYCLALDENRQTLRVADLDNQRVRSIDMKTGIVSTLAGNGKKGKPDDESLARSSPLIDPRAVAVDRNENVYILERSGNALRVVDRAGKIRTIAGTGRAGSSGDGGDAKKATFNGPKHLCTDSAGNVVIADTENHRIRIYRPSDGTIQNVAGTGKKGTAGLEGSAVEAELSQPHGVAIGPDGLLYIADSSNNRILKIVP